MLHRVNNCHFLSFNTSRLYFSWLFDKGYTCSELSGLDTASTLSEGYIREAVEIKMQVAYHFSDILFLSNSSQQQW